MKLLIIGGRKCGTTSLEKHLKNFDIKRVEQLFTRLDGRREYNENYSTRVPVLILRHPVRRAWSDYNYAKSMGRIPKDISLEDYARETLYVSKPLNFGELNILTQCNYSMWFSNWVDLNPIVYWLETVQKEPGFPHETKGNWPEPTKEEFKFLEDNIYDSGFFLNRLLETCTDREVLEFYAKKSRAV